MKTKNRFPRGKPKQGTNPDPYTTPDGWKRMLNIGIVLTIVATFGVIFGGCSSGKDETNKVVCSFETPNTMVCEFASKVDADGKQIGSVALDASKMESIEVASAGVNFGDAKLGNLGGLPFIFLGILSPAFAFATRRRRYVPTTLARSKTENFQFLGIAFLAVLFGIIMLNNGFAVTVALTPLLVVGGTAVLFSAKPVVGFAMCGAYDTGAKSDAVTTVNPRLAELSEKNYQSCLKAFQVAISMGEWRILEVKEELEELCFMTPEAVEKAYLEVVGR